MFSVNIYLQLLFPADLKNKRPISIVKIFLCRVGNNVFVGRALITLRFKEIATSPCRIKGRGPFQRFIQCDSCKKEQLGSGEVRTRGLLRVKQT